MTAIVKYDGDVEIVTEEGFKILIPLRKILDNLDADGLETLIEHVTEGAILDKAVERLCGTALHYEIPTDRRRAVKVLRAMEGQVFQTNAWGLLDEMERTLCNEIMQREHGYGAEDRMSYDTRSTLIDIAHTRSRRLRKWVALKMEKLIAEVRMEKEGITEQDIAETMLPPEGGIQ